MGELSRLSPGLHGFHIHETGDLSDECRGAGGHYNPGGTNHGAPDAEVTQRAVCNKIDQQASLLLADICLRIVTRSSSCEMRGGGERMEAGGNVC